ncbi:MAG TPA: NrsF family protein [Candidatus Binatus sp.]|nr:NrsF family protein [Candidatus Binatus sp.]
MTPDRTPPLHDALVARLKADLTPVRPLWAPSVRLAWWLVLAGSVIAIAMEIGLRHDLATQLRRPLYLLQLGTLLGAGTAAAGAAFRGAVPGRENRPMGYLGLVLGLLSGAVVLSEPAADAVSVGRFMESGLQCAFCVTLFGLLPWVVMLAAVARGAPLEGGATGAQAGGAAFAIGAVAVRVACPIDDPLHVLTWHMAPVLVWTALSAAVGSVWLMRWRRVARWIPPRYGPA